MYAVTAGTAQLFGMKKGQPLVIPFGIIISALSPFIAKNFPKHLHMGLDITPKYIHLPFQIAIPVLALIVCYIRNGFKNKPIEQKNQCPRSNS